jgi:hypothetical protein
MKKAVGDGRPSQIFVDDLLAAQSVADALAAPAKPWRLCRISSGSRAEQGGPLISKKSPQVE